MKIALCGFGSVGTAIYELLETNKTFITQVQIECIFVKSQTKKRPLSIQPKLVFSEEELFKHEFDILIDVLSSDEPAYTIIKKALIQKKHVVSANKAVVQKHFLELHKLAFDNDVAFLYEASVLSGMPVIHAMHELVETDITDYIAGIMNGSTNYCLTKAFNDHIPFNEAIIEAKNLGYLESDPSQDMDGFDSLRKTLILTSIAFHQVVDMSSCYCYSLKNCNDAFILNLKKNNMVCKYIASATKIGDEISVVVEPVAIHFNHYLSQINYETNILVSNFINRGMVSWIGKGAGGIPTASGILSDLYQILSNTYLKHDYQDIKVRQSILDESLSSYIILPSSSIDFTIVEKIEDGFITTKPITKVQLQANLEHIHFYARIERE